MNAYQKLTTVNTRLSELIDVAAEIRELEYQKDLLVRQIRRDEGLCQECGIGEPKWHFGLSKDRVNKVCNHCGANS